MNKSSRWLQVGSGVVLVALLISAWHPFDRLTWLMEVVPVLVVFPLIWLMRRRFPLTRLLLVLICVHALVLILGGAYSYARVPLGFWLQDWWGLSRNPYDKIGHLMQGIVPALAARELLIRRRWVCFERAANVLAICVALSVSLLYELLEWWAAEILGQGAEEFLGTQGYMWDTQSDMFFALLGACAAVGLLARWHSRMIRRIGHW